MATAQVNQKVFVSPGVYTSETDLSFVAQSVGVTTLGLVGETIKGPAFEPIFITNYDEFQAFFGGSEPTKFVNTQIPKYEAAYIAKSYLQQSNQLFVTRVLGLSGYDAGPSWSLTVNANVDPTTIGLSTGVGTAFTVNFEGNSTGNTFSFTTGSLPPNPSLSSTTSVFYGAILESDYWDVVDQFSAVTNQYGSDSVNLGQNDLTAASNDAWYYANFGNYSADNYSGYSWYYTVSSLSGNSSSAFTGTITGMSYNFSGTAFGEYNGMVVATLRSRGISLFANEATGLFMR